MRIRVGRRQETANTATRAEALPAAGEASEPLPGADEASEPLPATGEAPERLGRYVLGELLGIGGMGRVLAAYDPELDREVALKLLWRSDPLLLVRFLQEAQLQARLDHPNICKIYEVEAGGGSPYIAMQRVRGGGLLDAALELEWDELLEILIRCAEAVQAAHAAGMIHRDLKPGNILLERDGAGRWQPRLVDFGLAKDLGSQGLTQGSRVLGTPAYMAPEQALGQGVSVRSDLYALGATFYAFLGGAAPYQAVSATELLVKQSREEPPPLLQLNPELPPALAAIIGNCMQRRPELRYGSAAALAADLRRLQAGLPIEVHGPGRIRQGLAAAALIGLLAAAGWAIARPSVPPLAGRSGSPARPLRVLRLTVQIGPGADAFLARCLNGELAKALADGGDVLQVPRQGDPAASLRSQALASGADLLVTLNVREQAGRQLATIATLRPGQWFSHRLLQLSFDRNDYLAVEKRLRFGLRQRLGLPAAAPRRYFQPSLESRQAMASINTLADNQQNSESVRLAMGILRKVLTVDPDYMEAHLALASLLNALASEAAHHGRLQEIDQRLIEARAEVETASRLEPWSATPYWHLSETLRLRGDLDGAERAAQLGMEREPAAADGPYLLGILLGLRPGPEAFSAALRYTGQGIERMPRRSEPYYRLAQLHLDAGQFQRSLEAADRALALAPSMEYAHVVRSNALLWGGRGAEAEAGLQAAQALVPNARLIKRNLVYSAFLRRDPATFAARLAKARDLWPQGHPTRTFLAGLEEAFQGRWQLVRRRYGTALAAARAQFGRMPFTERNSLSVDFYLLGRVLAESPDPASARPFILFAERLHPKRLRMAQLDPAFRGLWPEPAPWPGD